MKLEETKEFYMKYGGREFHMSREEPDKYREYRAFPVSQEMKRECISALTPTDKQDVGLTHE